MKEYKYLIQNLKKINIYIYILITTLIAIVSLIIPAINGRFMDGILTYKNTKILYTYMFVMMGIFFLDTILQYILRKLYCRVQMGLSYSINKHIIRHLQKVSFLNVKKYESVYLTQIINNDSNNISTFALNTIQNLTSNSLQFIITMYVYYNINMYLPIVFLGIYIIYFGILGIFKNKLYTYNLKLTELKGELFSKLCKPFQKYKSIKALGVEEEVIQSIEESYEENLKININFQVLNWKVMSAESFVTTISQIGIFLICGLKVIEGTLTIGEFTILSTYFNMFLGSAKYFYNLGANLKNIQVSHNRICKFLDYKLQSNGKEILKKIDNIEIKDLKIQHSEKLIIFKDKIFEKNQIYIIKGENGKGKTTLIDLICGLYDNYDGNININDININDINMFSLRKEHISYFEQTTNMIKDNIRDEILLLSSNKNIDNIFDLNEKLRLFEKKELMQLINNDGNFDKDNVSLGEMQKISLIKVFIELKNILILDEPTNFLDKKSIDSLLRYIDTVKKDKIIIIITHDINVLEKFNDIYEV